MVTMVPPAPRPPAGIAFWQALLCALLLIGSLSVVGYHWIIPALLDRPTGLLPVTVLHETSEEALEEEEKPPMRRTMGRPVHVAVPRLRPRPVLPRVTVVLDQPQVDLTLAPVDLDELLEEAAKPFPSAPIAETVKPKPKENTRIRQNIKSKAVTSSRPRPVAPKGPTRAARKRKHVEPIYPRSARRAGIEGMVMLSVEVRSNGRVGSVRVARTSGSRALDSSALAAVKKWVFDPALSNGQAVLSKVSVPVVFGFELE